ncbi:MAG: hypothetical protein MZW92_76230 [Comamonadaceae bacterium]|nr:hypothetical protein [Comamonadaceae bacterium]
MHPPRRAAGQASAAQAVPNQHRVRGAGLRLHVHGRSSSSLTLLLAFTGLGHRHRLLRRGRQHQQHRPGPQPGRAVDDLRRARRLPDLGLHRRHAARAAGNLHRAGRAVHPAFWRK